MTLLDDPAFVRYLAAKRSVDDRAINGRVWAALRAALPPSPAERPLRVLEIGAGIGTMVERLLAWGAVEHAEYVALEPHPACLEAMRARLRSLAAQIALRVDPASLERFADDARGRGQTWDLVVASAVLDLFDVPAALDRIRPLLAPRGLLYCPITFDGGTFFEPPHAFDRVVEDAYHRSMDERRPLGRPADGSRTGRRLLGRLRAGGFDTLAAGGSDWVVFGGAGGYPEDEAFFLRTLVDNIGRELRGRPGLEPRRLDAWLAARRTQIEAGELVLIVHQIDVLARA